MNTKKMSHRNHEKQLGRNRQRGIALVFTLLLLTMMIALSLAMAIAIGSQTMIAGYYKNYRGAFYAADSGVNIMRQAMLNQLAAAVPTTVTTGVAPIPSTTAATILTNVQTAYAGWNSVNSTGSWPEQFQLSNGTAVFALASCTPTWTGAGTGFTCASPPTSPNILTGYQYVYTYSVTAIGQVQNSEQQSVTDSGNLIVNISVTPSAATTTLFSAWGMFIDRANECDGTTLVPGTITGPVFTNGGFTFTPSTYIFTDNVGFGSATAGFSPTNGGSCTQTANPSYTDNVSGNRQTIAPQFNGAAGLQLGQNPIAVPTNSINQEWAVLDGLGTGTADSTSPTNAQMHANLISTSSGGSQTAYPTAGATSGVYLPIGTTAAKCGAMTIPCMIGGGIYVEGNASAVTLTASTGPAGSGSHPLQTFTIVQGGTTTTIVEDLTSQTTTYQTNSGTVFSLAGLPVNNNTTPATPATMVYVDGDLGSGSTGLSGPGSGNPAVQNNSQVTVTANGNLTITGDILYKTEPVTTTQNQNVPYATTTCCNGDAADFLIPLPANASTQVLGIYTANGNIQLNNQQSSGNLEIDASVAAFSAGGGGGLLNTGSNIGTLNIVGGRIQSTIQNIGATTRNVYFDRRFAQGTFGPPWFPTAVVTPVNLSTTSVTTKAQRLQWLDNSATLN
jgi:Tfp pilus assembly protein PilX